MAQNNEREANPMTAPEGLVEAVEAAIRESHLGTNGSSVTDHAELAQAALAAQSEWMRAAGFVVVPVEPTEAMLQEGYYRTHVYFAHDGSGSDENTLREIYTAMLAAAPQSDGGA